MTCSSIDVLPDDILAQILELGYDPSSWRDNFNVLVSHVSQRLRAVALSTPRIWTGLNNFQSKEERQTFIARSGAADLQIYINHGITERAPRNFFREIHELSVSSPGSFLHDVIQHCKRWSEFFYTFHERNMDWHEFPPSLQTRTDPQLVLDLPRLTTLSCSEYGLFSFMPEIRFLLPPSMPCLTTLHWANVGPNILASHASLSHRETKLTRRLSQEMWSEGLLGLLKVSPHLKSLDLAFNSHSVHEDSKFLSITVPNLTSLVITVEGPSYLHSLGELFRALGVPELTHLKVKINSTSEECRVSRIIDIIVPREDVYPRLQSFEVAFPYLGNSQQDHVFMGMIETRIPRLEVMTFGWTGIISVDYVRILRSARAVIGGLNVTEVSALRCAVFSPYPISAYCFSASVKTVEIEDSMRTLLTLDAGIQGSAQAR